MRIHLRDNTIVLYKRPRSPFWQAELRYPANKTKIPISTKTANEHEAAAYAIKVYDDKKAIAKPVKSKDIFSLYCTKYRQLLLNKPKKKPIYFTYIRHMENYIEPYLGNKTTITDNDIEEYYDWFEREIFKKVGDVPAKNTINAMNIALRGVLRVAKNEGFISEMPTVSVKNRGRKGVRRNAVDLATFKALMNASRAWMNEPCHMKLSTHKRKVLHSMMWTIGLTGIRPGTEIRHVEWQNVKHIDDYTRILIIKGKKDKPRVVMAPSLLWTHLDEELRPITGQGKYLFAMPDGEPFRHEGNMVRDLLKYANMPPIYSLYSLRHFFATRMLVKKKMPYEILAKQMGTKAKQLETFYDHSIIESFREFFD